MVTSMVATASSTPSAKNSSRLLGVELTRGIAAYGVIVIHAGLVCES